MLKCASITITDLIVGKDDPILKDLYEEAKKDALNWQTHRIKGTIQDINQTDYSKVGSSIIFDDNIAMVYGEMKKSNATLVVVFKEIKYKGKPIIEMLQNSEKA